MGEDSKSTPRKHLSWQYIINAAVVASANPTANCNMNQFFLSITRGSKSSPEVSDYQHESLPVDIDSENTSIALMCVRTHQISRRRTMG
jgi:hypothetical protein